jgi:short chain dehydrogenase
VNSIYEGVVRWVYTAVFEAILSEKFPCVTRSYPPLSARIMTSLKISSSDPPSLANKVAIITGGGSGIGLATARIFAEHGTHVVIAELKPPVTSVSSSTFAKCDVTIWANILSAFSLAVEKFGAIDILIANASVSEIDSDLFRDE